MPRNTSIDSTASSISSASVPRLGSSSAYRLSEASGPQDAASIIAAAGSPEAAIQKLLNEKSSAASHNAQLWRLVEKQRAMILGLNRDLEKTMKEKERYRRKLKESLVQSSSAPTLTAAGQQVDDLIRREGSQSPAMPDHVSVASSSVTTRNDSISIASRKVSDASESISTVNGRSDTPQDVGNASSSTLPTTPQSASSTQAANKELERVNAITAETPTAQSSSKPVSPLTLATNTRTPPMSPKNTTMSPKSPEKGPFASPPASAASFSGAFKGASRKAPPAPLNLSPKPQPTITNNIVDASESEYEDDPSTAHSEQTTRGRRKTREDDDREREAVAREEEEYRSQSKKEKKSKSKSKSQPPAEKPAVALEFASPPPPPAHHNAPDGGQRSFEPTADPAAILRQRAISDAAGVLQRNVTAPPLMSPGLPMSPRPGDRPMNSPMPRAPNKALNSIPMSPRAGLPLSPRPPKQPIPMPPQTPSAFANSHLARAEAYQHMSQPSQSSIGSNSLLKPSPDPSPEHERPAQWSEAKSPGEVYRGLVTDQYPDLLLPPNALPSILVKTASSRMRPSRQSFMAPKHFDENPVFTLSVHGRSDGKQLWRAEKTLNALAVLDHQVKQATPFRDRVPDKTLFTGHAPAKIDARRQALDYYFDRMLDTIQDERAAKIVCKFLSTDAYGAESGDYFPTAGEPRPDTPVNRSRTRRDGYLTKRGKNFGGWKARYFVLDGPALKYFEAPGGAQLGSIKLHKAQIGKQSPGSSQTPAEDEDNQFRHAFLILEPKRKDSNSLVRHVLCAESDEERDAWVDALLQYVDYRSEDEEVGRGIPITRSDISAPRSPRVQRSQNEPRTSSRGPHAQYLDAVRSVGYEQTIAGEAPVMGPPTNGRTVDTPSPPYDSGFSGNSSGASEHSGPQHPMISGPSNAHVIQNAGDWGMRPPPTPSYQQKEKKRGLFGFRGRSSSDLGPEKSTPNAGGSELGRAVFGAPLAEAVEMARPVGVATDLPAVVYRCIEYLSDKGAITEEGIFRLSGSNTVIKALRDRFNTEGDVDLLGDGRYYDIHAVASLLKLYLRELPASILTRDLHLDFLSCLEMNERDKIVALNVLVNKLPRANRALLEALSTFLLSIVNNADVNKMNVRNGKLCFGERDHRTHTNGIAVGIVFSPTLNVPGPLISCFVEDLAQIFGPPVDEAHSPIKTRAENLSVPTQSAELRSPRKQMFSDLPTPSYNQPTFQSLGALQAQNPNVVPYTNDTGMAPMRPNYLDYQMAPQGEGGYGSLNDALRSPTVFGTAANGAPTPRDAKNKRRESSMMFMTAPQQMPKQSSRSRLRDEEGASF